MLTLLSPRVWDEITSAASNCKMPAHVAVAYFGAHGDRMLPLPRGSRLVVDATIPTLVAGSTCPGALERLHRKGVEIYSAQFLHAKAYAFDHLAFIGSANASERSQRMLLEALLRVDSSEIIASVREFVESVCVTRLSAQDLAELAQHYRPPRFQPPAPSVSQVHLSTLLMELTKEQGGNRVTQVQPPKAVWEHYFGIRVGVDTPPVLSLVNELVGSGGVVRREVVEHDHKFTIEIAGAEMPRPAILRMRRRQGNVYGYSVLRPGLKGYESAKRLLEASHNPLRHSGRLWILI